MTDPINIGECYTLPAILIIEPWVIHCSVTKTIVCRRFGFNSCACEEVKNGPSDNAKIKSPGLLRPISSECKCAFQHSRTETKIIDVMMTTTLNYQARLIYSFSDFLKVYLFYCLGSRPRKEKRQLRFNRNKKN